ncbi:MAG: hypothetical protein U0871_22800 [Gemmataceae bacterium]
MHGRRLLTHWLSGMAVAAGAAPVIAQTPLPNCPPVVMPNCPPAAPGAAPTSPDAALPPPDSAAAAALAQAPAAGTGGGTSIAPNMMGDLFGARSVRLSFDRDLIVRFSNVTAAPGGVLVTPGNGIYRLQPTLGSSGQPFPNNPPGSFARPATPLTGLDPFVQQLVNNSIATSEQTQIARTILQAGLSGRNLTAAEVAALPPNLRAQLPAIQNVLNAEITRATNGLTIPSLTVKEVKGELISNGARFPAGTGSAPPINTGAVPGSPVPFQPPPAEAAAQAVDVGTLQYMALLTGSVTVPLPGASSVVGRVKLSEDNNPIPLDRFIFNYDYFNNVPFTDNGIGVNRFQFGIEKTFLDGRASVEFRLPFAGTLNSTTTQSLETTNTELGNVRFAFKYLWARGQYAALSSGLGVTLPTANDTTVNSVDGSLLYHLKNESVQLEPFVALLLTPNDRLFGQSWASVNFDAGGGQLTWNQQVFGGSGSARIWDVPVLALDNQIGYWVVKRDFGTVRGLAPFLELHWNYAIAQDQINRELNDSLGNQGLRVQTIGNSELNLTAGVTTQIGNNLRITLGGTAPMFQQPNRTFDGQFGLRVNYFFGRTAAAIAAPAPNSF